MSNSYRKKKRRKLRQNAISYRCSKMYSTNENRLKCTTETDRAPHTSVGIITDGRRLFRTGRVTFEIVMFFSGFIFSTIERSDIRLIGRIEKVISPHNRIDSISQRFRYSLS